MLDVGTFARHIVATGNTLAEIGVATGTAIVYIVVAKTVLIVEFQHEDSARPRTIGHPQLALLIEEHAGVYIVGQTGLRGVCPRTVIASGQRAECSQYQFHIGVLVAVAAIVEAADDNGSLIFPCIGNLICREQNDARVPGIAVDAEVHAPLLHRRVPQHIGSPHVPVNVVGSIGAPCPVHGVKLREVNFLSALHDLLHGRGHEGILVGGIVVRPHLPLRVGLCPTLQISGVGASLMRSKDVVALRGFLVDDRWVVHADTLHGDVPIQALCLVGRQLNALCMAR